MAEPLRMGEPKLTVFISYVREDSAICDALSNALNDAFGRQIKVFMDRVSIQQGENIRETIKTNLANADVLAVISTGTERPSFDWAGFELGFFSATHKEPRSDSPLWGKVVAFCAPGREPRPHSSERYIPLDLDTPLDRTPTEFDERLVVDNNDPLMLWFGELLKAVSGEELDLKAGIQDKFRHTVAEFKGRVFAEYRRRPKAVLRPQKQLVIRYESAATTRGLVQSPASISFHGGAASVFGMPDGDSNPVPWQVFGERVAPNRLGTFWTTTLAKILDIGGSAELIQANQGLIASYNQSRLFRAVLTSWTTYHDGSAEANIYLIEVQRRADFGNPKTTVLLKALQLTCRFRFLFLEKQSDFYYLNVQVADRKNLRSLANRIATELDLLQSDSVDADLDKPGTYAGFLADSQLLAMTQDWLPLEQQLRKACAAAINADEDSTAAGADLAAALREVFDRMRPHNDLMLKAMTDELAEFIDSDETDIRTVGL